MNRIQKLQCMDGEINIQYRDLGIHRHKNIEIQTHNHMTQDNHTKTR